MPRPTRPSPRELTPSWPDESATDAAGEVARRLAANLRSVIGERSIRSVAAHAEVNHATLLAILAGRVWPDAYTIATLESALGADLWPGRVE